MTRIPFQHQQKIFDLAPKRHVFVWGTGVGKTYVSLGLMEIHKVKKPVIIVPKGLKTQWRIEAPHARVLTKEYVRDHLNELLSEPREEWQAIICDEFHYFLGMKSGMSKALLKLLKQHQPEYFYSLTATPYRSTPWDVYRLMQFFGKHFSYKGFEERFFFRIPIQKKNPNSTFPVRTVPKPRKDEATRNVLINMIRSVGSVVAMEDCFDVPEQTFEVIKVSLTDSQKKGIEALTELMPMTYYNYVQQICGGVLKEDDYRPLQEYETEKYDVLYDLVVSNKQMIVVCKYRAEINMLARKLKEDFKGLHIGVIHGDIDNRHEVLRECEAKGEFVLLVAAQCSEGWEMKKCPLMVFYSYDYSLKNYIQMIGRIQRSDNLKKNVYVSILTEGQIDEEVYNTVVNEKADFHYKIYKKDVNKESSIN